MSTHAPNLNFASDNAYGAAPEIIDAIARANAGPAASYGADALSARVTERLCDVFETEVTAHLVATGTAANSLALSCLAPPWGAIFMHREAHADVDECGAPEFYTGGAKLVGLAGEDGKLTVDGFRKALDGWPTGFVHSVQPAALTLTQATEAGTVYSVDEICGLASVAKSAGLGVHMDGARFANAVVATNASPAELTWKAGVDILSFGATKNGCLGVEAIVLFDDARAKDWEVQLRRKRAGHLFSKARFLAAQMDAYLEDRLWLRLAAHANAAARRLAAGAATVAGVRVAQPVGANMVFLDMPQAAAEALAQRGAVFFAHGEGGFHRFVCSFLTEDAQVDALVAALRESAAAAA